MAFYIKNWSCTEANIEKVNFCSTFTALPKLTWQAADGLETKYRFVVNCGDFIQGEQNRGQGN